ncbi:MAG: AAA family ATPase [Deltaproteobacteria bacterium]|nr:AAA family ATPase [Deltaproteobacteria bacterium]
MPAAIPLGAFTLDSVLGGGGSGIVWRGRHRRLELPVAAKVLAPRASRYALHALKNEVQAVARLQHPHIIAVLDTGVVDEAAAEASQSRTRPLVLGSPWMVVELARGGDLHRLAPPCPWGVISDVLRTLLAALAHAHARGVIHRDLKPQNVLLCTDEDERPGLKLTDFGIALTDAALEDIGGGTPLFMAPEQFDIPIVDAGPWTDLYALGCLATWLATGSPPFRADRWSGYADLHRRHPPSPLPATVDAPAGFGAWVARLLEKDPAARFRRAADADAALAELDVGRASPPADRLPQELLAALTHQRAPADASTAPTLRRDAAAALATEILPAPTASPSPSSSPSSSPPSSPRSSPRSSLGGQTTAPPPSGTARMPSTWRTAGASSPPPRLLEAGLSLFALRPVPLVGRAEERDTLWRTLLEVHEARSPRVLALRGPSGIGKSRLVEWLSHRAHETGAAIVLAATFAPSPGRADGFSGAVARLIGVAGVPADEAERRARAWRDRWLGRADLTARELCALAGVEEGVFANSQEKDGALIRLLAALGRERPLLVWLDDVHWARHALALVERVLTDARELPVLFVCTAVDELCDMGVRAQLEALLAKPGATSLPLDRLDDGTAAELCEQLLGRAAPALAETLRRRTEGNPLFAVHLVRDWVLRGLLVPGPQGLALAEGAELDLPDALHALWDRRVAAALDSDEERAALEVAATLGGVVDLVEWETACADEGLHSRVLDVLLDAVVKAGLARRTDEGLAFVHVLVRGSIERRARDEGRQARHHRAAATALELLWGTDTPVAAARIGRHRLAAGEALRALPLLFSAARTAVEEGDVLEAKGLLEDWQRARAACGLEADDGEAAPALVLRATVADREGHHDEAERLATRAAAVTSDRRLYARARRVAAEAALATGALDRAAALLEEASALCVSIDDRLGLAQSLRALGDVCYWRGERSQSAVLYKEAHELFQTVGKASDVAQSLWSLGYVELERGDLDKARALFEEQRDLCRKVRDRLGEANADNALGELARRQSRFDEAEAHYRAALRIATKSGLSRRWIFRLNLAHTRLARGDAAGAAALVEELLGSSTAAHEPMVAAPAWWITAVAAAERRDLPAWDRAVARALEVAAQSEVVEEDLIEVAAAAARRMEPLDGARAAAAARYAEQKRAALKPGV